MKSAKKEKKRLAEAAVGFHLKSISDTPRGAIMTFSYPDGSEKEAFVPEGGDVLLTLLEEYWSSHQPE